MFSKLKVTRLKAGFFLSAQCSRIKSWVSEEGKLISGSGVVTASGADRGPGGRGGGRGAKRCGKVQSHHAKAAGEGEEEQEKELKLPTTGGCGEG
ncbi:hypothetical protein JOB18_001780 [Solea senegalensis]|uniref:Uncharacterized protein n=1 Tax=Solea senegalensis TaxID=28829 RepID=A0AAV6S8X7_SOLSE|nr:hypothetical protein JOB18_001780 [Solea senegalensis]